jgi:hypothetical protein
VALPVNLSEGFAEARSSRVPRSVIALALRGLRRSGPRGFRFAQP